MEAYCIKTYYLKSHPPHPLPSPSPLAGAERMLRRERGRSVNSHRIQAEITMLAVTDLTDFHGPHAGTFLRFTALSEGFSSNPRPLSF